MNLEELSAGIIRNSSSSAVIGISNVSRLV